MTEKIAVSASRALGVLRARAAQGAAVGAPAMQMAQQAAGAAATPASLRKLVLSAGDDVRAARQTAAFASHPIPAARRSAAEAVHGLEETDPWRMFDLNRVEGKTLDLPWSTPEKRQMLFGTGAELHDPAGLIPRPPPPVSGYAKTVAAPTPGPQFPLPQTPRPNADTVARHRRPANAGAPVDPALAPTQVTGRPARPLGAQQASAEPPPPQPVQRPLVPAAQDVTVAKRRPKTASVAGERDAEGTFPRTPLFGEATGIPGRTQQLELDPSQQVRSAFAEQQRMLDTQTPAEPKYAARKLHARVSFRGLAISIENRRGSHRHWHDPHTGRDGKTKMKHPYGYIRRTTGLDGDHVDVFVGPNEQAKNVYVILTSKAPDFKQRDEEKCMLGFDTAEEAKSAFHEHYNDERFFRSMKTMPFEKFKSWVLGTFDKRAYDTDETIRQRDLAYPHPTGEGLEPLTDPRGGVEKGLGFPLVGDQRKIVGEGMSPDDRTDRQFRFMDQPQSTTAVEGAWGAPEGAPVL